MPSASARWTIAAAVVVVALVVAIWPRDSNDGSSTENAQSAQVSSATDGANTAGVATPTGTPGELAAARSAAALEPCRVGGSPQVAKLAGITAECLGDAATVAMAGITQGRPTVLNFWAAWCAPCREELPVMQDFARASGDKVTVMTVHARDGAQDPIAALALLRDLGVHLPAVLDSRGQIAGALGVPPVLPTTVLIRADGSVAKVVPTVFTSVDQIRSTVADALGVSL
ncbi:TlpA disulfide reductase family protein [Gordonia jinhuaensis]|nr:TlpA disulfide reductase family protein [Gordonia jinhuaensis]